MKPDKNQCYLGIDPGVQGGIVMLCPQGHVVFHTSMPDTEQKLWELFRNVVLVHQAHYRASRIKTVIEWINPSIFGIKKAHMSKLYGNYMQLRAMLIACGIQFEAVRPQEWQPALGIDKKLKNETTTGWKKRLLAKAKRLYPKEALWKRLRAQKDQLAVADAFLIANYCYNQK